MLASCVDIASLTFPVLCTPKYDGIRCLIRGGIPVSRTLTPIPNHHVQSILKDCPDGLDGELICNDNFNKTQSGVMSVDAKTDVTYNVFDIVSDAPYTERMKTLATTHLPPVCRKLLPVRITTRTSLLAYETRCLRAGFEGIMIRSPEGPYKSGRSTVKEAYLLKLKRFTDAEAKIIGYAERMRNDNELTYDNLGYARRSSAHSGKTPLGTLGAFVVENEEGGRFKVSTGMTDQDRAVYWEMRDECIGQVVKFKFQESGAKNVPRFPVFLGFRDVMDM